MQKKKKRRAGVCALGKKGHPERRKLAETRDQRKFKDLSINVVRLVGPQLKFCIRLQLVSLLAA